MGQKRFLTLPAQNAARRPRPMVKHGQKSFITDLSALVAEATPSHVFECGEARRGDSVALATLLKSFKSRIQ
jgi:hypothetical protein